jgi:hypothetical protein
MSDKPVSADVDLADLAAIGSRIVELGMKLKELKVERDKIDADIAVVEKELMPLVAQHGKIIASVTGAVMTPPKPAAPPRDPNAPAHPTRQPANVSKARVMDFIKTRAVEGMSALDIADVLKVDALIVRECMKELADQRASRTAK